MTDRPPRRATPRVLKPPARPPATPHRGRQPAAAADPSSTVTPTRAEARSAAHGGKRGRSLSADELDLAILRNVRRFPNQTVDLAPLAQELEVDAAEIQLAVERLHGRRMVVAPFIETGPAGGATLTEIGLRWLIEREGGRPSEVPVLLQRATSHVRAPDEAARLPRAQVYGVRRT